MWPHNPCWSLRDLWARCGPVHFGGVYGNSELWPHTLRWKSTAPESFWKLLKIDVVKENGCHNWSFSNWKWFQDKSLWLMIKWIKTPLRFYRLTAILPDILHFSTSMIICPTFSLILEGLYIATAFFVSSLECCNNFLLNWYSPELSVSKNELRKLKEFRRIFF